MQAREARMPRFRNIDAGEARLRCAIEGEGPQGEMFTAYDVTMALRVANGHLKISHNDVRPLVHAQMEPAVISGVYQRESATFGVDTATRYLPA